MQAVASPSVKHSHRPVSAGRGVHPPQCTLVLKLWAEGVTCPKRHFVGRQPLHMHLPAQRALRRQQSRLTPLVPTLPGALSICTTRAAIMPWALSMCYSCSHLAMGTVNVPLMQHSYLIWIWKRDRDQRSGTKGVPQRVIGRTAPLAAPRPSRPSRTHSFRQTQPQGGPLPKGQGSAHRSTTTRPRPC